MRILRSRRCAMLLLLALSAAWAASAQEQGLADAGQDSIVRGQQALPCESDPRYDELDFWLGEWEVFDAQGRRAGHSRVERLLGGCLILENWESARGGAGKSLNYFDPGDGRWRQDWVDTSGRVIHYEGGLEDGAMRLAGSLAAPAKAGQLSRMSLSPLPPGGVLQVIEVSADGGETWQTWFRGEYRPAGKAAGGP